MYALRVRFPVQEHTSGEADEGSDGKVWLLTASLHWTSLSAVVAKVSNGTV
jgi:hypothetical protein